MNTTRRGLLLTIGAVSLCLISVELGLRIVGLHELPMYESSDKYEYRFVPNQRCSMFGKNLIINNLGLRGELPDGTNDVIVWYCGDSVINGGIHSDEDSLATTIGTSMRRIYFVQALQLSMSVKEVGVQKILSAFARIIRQSWANLI